MWSSWSFSPEVFFTSVARGVLASNIFATEVCDRMRSITAQCLLLLVGASDFASLPVWLTDWLAYGAEYKHYDEG